MGREGGRIQRSCSIPVPSSCTRLGPFNAIAITPPPPPRLVVILYHKARLRAREEVERELLERKQRQLRERLEREKRREVSMSFFTSVFSSQTSRVPNQPQIIGGITG